MNVSVFHLILAQINVMSQRTGANKVQNLNHHFGPNILAGFKIFVFQKMHIFIALVLLCM